MVERLKEGYESDVNEDEGIGDNDDGLSSEEEIPQDTSDRSVLCIVVGGLDRDLCELSLSYVTPLIRDSLGIPSKLGAKVT